MSWAPFPSPSNPSLVSHFPSLCPVSLLPKAPERGSGVPHQVTKVSCPTLLCYWAPICGCEQLTGTLDPLSHSLMCPINAKANAFTSWSLAFCPLLPSSPSPRLHAAQLTPHLALVMAPPSWPTALCLSPLACPPGRSPHRDVSRFLVIRVEEKVVVSECW